MPRDDPKCSGGSQCRDVVPLRTLLRAVRNVAPPGYVAVLAVGLTPGAACIDCTNESTQSVTYRVRLELMTSTQMGITKTKMVCCSRIGMLDSS